jgi:hypothetical protein
MDILYIRALVLRECFPTRCLAMNIHVTLYFYRAEYFNVTFKEHEGIRNGLLVIKMRENIGTKRMEEYHI